jgi:DNA-binding MarR family transcriptional regulator
MDNALQAADVLVVAKLAASEQPSPSLRRLGEDLGLSKSAVGNAIQKLRDLDLVKEDERGRRVNRVALRDFIEHAVRWIAPAKVGDFALGLPTAHASGVLADKLSGDDDPVVMPLPHGPVRGRAVPPIHPLAPRAAEKDPKLRDLLAIIDAFRIGSARQREVARTVLQSWL